MPRLVVYHEGYGCETGCCGHVIRIGEKVIGEQVGAFDFSHPYDGDFREFAEKMVREAGCDPANLDWEACEIKNDY